MVEPILPRETFQRADIDSGDIVIYSEVLKPEEENSIVYPTPDLYFESLANGITISFRSRTSPDDPSLGFYLPVSQSLTYDKLALLVAQKLGTDKLMVQNSCSTCSLFSPSFS